MPPHRTTVRGKFPTPVAFAGLLVNADVFFAGTFRFSVRSTLSSRVERYGDDRDVRPAGVLMAASVPLER